MTLTPIELSHPVYSDEEAARKHLEAIRWPNGPVCPHCGVTDQNRPLGGESMGAGWYYCEACKDKFTVRVGSIYERSHIPLHKWLLAFRLMASSKKGVSAHQLHRTLGITYKSAWFLAHRIREAMAPHAGSVEPMGGRGRTVEMDETYVGGKETNKHRSKRTPKLQGGSGKEIVISLVERGGKVRSHHVPAVNARNIGKILRAQLKEGSTLYTDQLKVYRSVRPIRHRPAETVNHSIGEYVRGDVHTNTIESYFSILKRGVVGTYHHVSEKHLKRYLAEFDFRYNERMALGVDDAERTTRAVKGAEGKRLTYRNPRRKAAREVAPDQP